MLPSAAILTLYLMKTIITNRYPPQHWNIFGCQISDGDNFPTDTPHAISVLEKDILPVSRYFAYIEIDSGFGGTSDLWPSYEGVKNSAKNMEMAVIDDITSIYPVFRSLFEKKTA